MFNEDRVKMKKLVSIIIPTYGGGEFLQRTIESALNQTYNEIEIIVVDDNGIGTENQLKTQEIIDRYKDNKKIKYICHEKNINGSAARNTGARNAKGWYIALLDDDDIFYASNIELQVKALNELDDTYALTYCSHELYKGDNKIEEKHVTESGYKLFELLSHKCNIESSCTVIRKSVWDEVNGFDESFKRHQDWEFIARIATKYKIKAVDEIGVRRYLEFRNSPKTPDQWKAYREYYLKKMESTISTLPIKQQKEVRLANMLDISIQYLKQKRFKEAAKIYINEKPGLYGVKYFIKRFLIQIQKKGLKAFKKNKFKQ